MSRSTPEWCGKNDDSAIPDRVKLRVFRRFGGVCQICGVKIISSPEYDHRVALINGGKNAESNIVPVHPKCHRSKSNADVAMKAATAKTQLHHLGIKKSRNPMFGSKASGWKKRMDGRVERRT